VGVSGAGGWEAYPQGADVPHRVASDLSGPNKEGGVGVGERSGHALSKKAIGFSAHRVVPALRCPHEVEG
jgi:hypothetical protein